MTRQLTLNKIEELIALDQRFLFTFTSYALILAVYINLTFFKSPAIGFVTFVLYSSINAIFLGHTFFEKEDTIIRLMFGALLLIMLLGFVGWLIMVIYNLDVTRFTLVLLVTTTISSWLNRGVKNKIATR